MGHCAVQLAQRLARDVPEIPRFAGLSPLGVRPRDLSARFRGYVSRFRLDRPEGLMQLFSQLVSDRIGSEATD